MTLLTVRTAFALDTGAALGPQLVAARAEPQPVGWKLLESATGICERQLRRIHADTIAGWRAPHFSKWPVNRTDKRRAMGETVPEPSWLKVPLRP